MKTHTMNIRLSTTNGEELYPEDFLLTTTDPVEPELVELVIEQFKEQNDDYYVNDVIEHILDHTGGKIESVEFVPDVDMIV